MILGLITLLLTVTFAMIVGVLAGGAVGAFLAFIGVSAATIATLGKIVVGIIVVRALFELGWFLATGHWVRQSNDLLPFEDCWVLRLLYDWIYDIDGTVARIVVNTIFECKMTYDLNLFDDGMFEWYGEEYES